MLKKPELAELIIALRSANDAERESAVARLTLMGSLAAPKVAAVARDANASPSARSAAFRVLSAGGETLAVDSAAAALRSDSAVVVEAACDLLGRLAREPGKDGSRALDELTGLALSAQASAESRLAAIAAFEGLPDRLMRPVYETLAKDTSSRIVSRAARARAGHAWSLETLVERGLIDDPALIAAAARDDAATTPVTVLRRAIDAARRRESEATADSREPWRAIRGALHEAVAHRGSRIALYDLRETLESSRETLPIGFLSAAAAVGDATCLESVATAWEQTDQNDRWYRDHLADVFGAIVRRENLTRDNPALKRVLIRRPAAAELVALAPRKPRAVR